MANAPLLGTGWRELVEMICLTAKAKYFFARGLDRKITDLPVEAGQEF